MKKLLYILFLGILLWGCNKLTEDFDENGRLRGRLSYVTTQNGETKSNYLANKIVRIATTGSDTLNFLYQTRTDAEGYFSFNGLKRGNKYDVFYSDSIEGILFTAFRDLIPDNDTVHLVATPDVTKQNGILITLLDGNGNPLPEAGICLFNNRSAAMQDTCLGSILQKTTDKYGQMRHYQLVPGRYYLRVSLTLDTLKYKTIDSIDVEATNVTPKTIVVPKTAVNKNGLKLRLVNGEGYPVNSVTVCFFNNRTLFLTDTCTGYIFQETTNSEGKLSRYDMPAGRYYYRALVSQGQSMLKRLDSIDVPVSGIASAQAVMEPFTYVKNGIEFFAVDIYGQPLYNAQLCIFNSKRLFEQDTCVGSIYQLNTALNGKAPLLNINEGQYYIYSVLQVGDLKLIGKDSVMVQPGTVISKQITLQ